MIAPAPMKPMPVTTPCMIFAFTVALAPNTEIAVCTSAQLAMATRGKVPKPALCSSRARCHPIGNARTNATSKWTRWSGVSPHWPRKLGISFLSHGELSHHSGAAAKLIRCEGGLDCSRCYHLPWLPDCSGRKMERCAECRAEPSRGLGMDKPAGYSFAQGRSGDRTVRSPSPPQGHGQNAHACDTGQSASHH